MQTLVGQMKNCTEDTSEYLSIQTDHESIFIKKDRNLWKIDIWIINYVCVHVHVCSKVPLFWS